jgi:hypothetical protein
VPLHAFVIRPAQHTPAETTEPAGRPPPSPIRLRAVAADRGFWLLAVGFTAHTAAITVITVAPTVWVVDDTGFGKDSPASACVADSGRVRGIRRAQGGNPPHWWCDAGTPMS